MTGVKNISARELEVLLKSGKILIYDIRTASEFRAYHINGSININSGLLLQSPDQYIGSRVCYIICESGKKSIALSYQLRKKGYNTYNVLGGLEQYLGSLESSV